MNLGGLVGSGLAAVVAAFVLYGVAARRARGIVAGAGPDRVHELRVILIKLTRVGAACGAGSGMVGVELTRWNGISPEAAIAAGAVALGCLVLPLVLARRPVVAAYARLRGVQVKALRSYRRGTGSLFALVALAWPAAVALAVPAGLPVRAVILVAGYLGVNPVLLGLAAAVTSWLLGARALPADLEARVAALAGRMGTEVRGRLVEARARKLANAWQVGWLPGLRYVLITDYLADELEPAEVDAVIAHELAHGRLRDARTRQFTGGLVFVPLGLLLVGALTPGPLPETLGLIITGLAVAVAGTRLRGRHAIRRELAADDLAAATVGAGALASALTRLTELNEIKRNTSLTWDRNVGHPAMAQRIARLEGQVPSGAAAALGPEK